MWEIPDEFGYDRLEHIVMRKKGKKIREPAQPISDNPGKYVMYDKN